MYSLKIFLDTGQTVELRFFDLNVVSDQAEDLEERGYYVEVKKVW